METSATKKLRDFQLYLDGRMQVLYEREQEILSELSTLKSTLDDAIIQGVEEDIEDKMEDLNLELSGVRRKLQTFQNPPLEGKYGDLIRAVWNESVDEITGALRQQFDAKVQELNEVRHIFLSLVAELGSIKRRADSITYSTMDLMQTMPGKKMGVPSLATGIISRQDRYSGPIFIDYQECDKAFKKGVK